jgi:hypothetical protein
MLSEKGLGSSIGAFLELYIIMGNRVEGMRR